MVEGGRERERERERKEGGGGEVCGGVEARKVLKDIDRGATVGAGGARFSPDARQSGGATLLCGRFFASPQVAESLRTVAVRRAASTEPQPREVRANKA